MPLKLPALRTGRALLPRNITVLLLLLVQLEGLGKLKQFIDVIGSRTRDLQGFCIEPQPLRYSVLPKMIEPMIIHKRTSIYDDLLLAVELDSI
jgi:hypothetical protein